MAKVQVTPYSMELFDKTQRMRYAGDKPLNHPAIANTKPRIRFPTGRSSTALLWDIVSAVEDESVCLLVVAATDS